MTPDETALERGDCMDHLVEVSDAALETACNGSMKRPAEDIAVDRSEFGQHRSVYDGNGEYEFASREHHCHEHGCDGVIWAALGRVAADAQNQVGVFCPYAPSFLRAAASVSAAAFVFPDVQRKHAARPM